MTCDPLLYIRKIIWKGKVKEMLRSRKGWGWTEPPSGWLIIKPLCGLVAGQHHVEERGKGLAVLKSRINIYSAINTHPTVPCDGFVRSIIWSAEERSLGNRRVDFECKDIVMAASVCRCGKHMPTCVHKSLVVDPRNSNKGDCTEP